MKIYIQIYAIIINRFNHTDIDIYRDIHIYIYTQINTIEINE